jgi:cbb3-type cytochrome oxidase subunit 3
VRLDGFGISGMVLHYATVMLFVGTAALVFFYLWKNNRLDMDEAPKYQMLNDEDDYGRS